MAKGKKTGGRVRGVPNKATAEMRSAIQLVYDGNISELSRWIRETGDGYEVVAVDKSGIPIVIDGKPLMVKTGKDPGKAADLMVKMAEFVSPKLGRTEHVGEGGGPLVVEVVKLG